VSDDGLYIRWGDVRHSGRVSDQVEIFHLHPAGAVVFGLHKVPVITGSASQDEHVRVGVIKGYRVKEESGAGTQFKVIHRDRGLDGLIRGRGVEGSGGKVAVGA
jgi:hypothetical protein